MAYHTIKPTKVYHIYDDCKVGNNIEPENRRSGKGGHDKLCEQCERMAAKKRK